MRAIPENYSLKRYLLFMLVFFLSMFAGNKTEYLVLGNETSLSASNQHSGYELSPSYQAHDKKNSITQIISTPENTKSYLVGNKWINDTLFGIYELIFNNDRTYSIEEHHDGYYDHSKGIYEIQGNTIILVPGNDRTFHVAFHEPTSFILEEHPESLLCKTRLRYTGFAKIEAKYCSFECPSDPPAEGSIRIHNGIKVLFTRQEGITSVATPLYREPSLTAPTLKVFIGDVNSYSDMYTMENYSPVLPKKYLIYTLCKTDNVQQENDSPDMWYYISVNTLVALPDERKIMYKGHGWVPAGNISFE